MPNWCENRLRVSGNAVKLDKFIEEVRDEDQVFSFEHILPCPREIRDLHVGFRKIDGKDVRLWREIQEDGETKCIAVDGAALKKKYGHSNWYDWNCANWGTKWGACHTTGPEMSREGRCATYRFDTAWSPPEPVISAAAKMYPELTFDLRYWEGGNGFKGQLKLKGNEVLERWSGDYNGGRGG